MRLRKYLAIVLKTVFSLSLCFSLAGCDDEDNEPEQKIYSDFELYHGDRYFKEYTYYYSKLYVYDEYDEVYETYRRVDTTWDNDDLIYPVYYSYIPEVVGATERNWTFIFWASKPQYLNFRVK